MGIRRGGSHNGSNKGGPLSGSTTGVWARVLQGEYTNGGTAGRSPKGGPTRRVHRVCPKMGVHKRVLTGWIQQWGSAKGCPTKGVRKRGVPQVGSHKEGPQGGSASGGPHKWVRLGGSPMRFKWGPQMGVPQWWFPRGCNMGSPKGGSIRGYPGGPAVCPLKEVPSGSPKRGLSTGVPQEGSPNGPRNWVPKRRSLNGGPTSEFPKGCPPRGSQNMFPKEGPNWFPQGGSPKFSSKGDPQRDVPQWGSR
jgi:hypothetical protein